MAISKAEILDAVSAMSVLDLSELIKDMDCLLYTSPSPRD